MLQETAELWAWAQAAHWALKGSFQRNPPPPPLYPVSARPSQGHCPVTCGRLSFHTARSLGKFLLGGH